MNALIQGHIKCKLETADNGQTYIQIKERKVKVRTNRCDCGRELLFDLIHDGTDYVLSAFCPTLDYGSIGTAHFIRSGNRQTTLDLFGGTI